VGLFNQFPGQELADKTGVAGDENFHLTIILNLSGFSIGTNNY
jgi:hypothetical protein